MIIIRGRRPKQEYPELEVIWQEQKGLRAAIKARLVELAGGKCLDCKGVFPPVCYDFHHRDPSSKLFEISGMRLIQWAEPELLEELAKCDLLCSNCHRIREWC
jgi:hypothetical protein